MVTVNQLAKQLLNLKNELQNKEVFIYTKHGMLIPPEIKFHLKDLSDLSKNEKNVESIVLM